MGEVRVKGEKLPGSRALENFGLKPVTLQSKEGLALLNGTQFMNAYGCWCILKAQQLEKAADLIGALSLDAFDGRIEPFHHLIHQIRPHAGQINTATRFRTILKGSELIDRPKSHVQDPYAFRCIPQVHGASKDAITYVSQIFFTEINSVTDNPTVFPDEELIISAGNFQIRIKDEDYKKANQKMNAFLEEIEKNTSKAADQAQATAANTGSMAE